MKFNKIAIAIIPLFVLTSCRSSYVEGAFFDETILKENQIENLPIPEGELLRKHDDTVFVNSNKTERDNYIDSVYAYIKSLNFKHFYGIDHVRTTLVASMYTLFVKDSENLDNHFYDVSNSYWFIYSDEDIGQLDENDERINTFGEYYINANVIKIDIASTEVKYDKKTFNATYIIEIEDKQNCCFGIS